MMSALQLPAELWLQVFSFLSWRDKLSVRCTCSHFRHLLDKSRPLWRASTCTVSLTYRRLSPLSCSDVTMTSLCLSNRRPPPGGVR
uniref:F-box domain-containing protein n=1 Tax=Dicentrarchus labrax TaxID=13489 RepID=A0A8P4JWV9_DICLA